MQPGAACCVHSQAANGMRAPRMVPELYPTTEPGAMVNKRLQARAEEAVAPVRSALKWPQAAMRVCSSPSRRRCLPEVLLFPNQAENLPTEPCQAALSEGAMSAALTSKCYASGAWRYSKCAASCSTQSATWHDLKHHHAAADPPHTTPQPGCTCCEAGRTERQGLQPAGSPPWEIWLIGVQAKGFPQAPHVGGGHDAAHDGSEGHEAPVAPYPDRLVDQVALHAREQCSGWELTS